MNVDPNNPTDVSTATLLTGSEKKMLDYVYDNWFSGRQALPYAQYWCQRNYTEEDRYQIRESVNNNYFNYFYTVAGNYELIEKLNTDESTKSVAALYGDNTNQIAVAKILKVWLMQVIADTWGSVPYSEAFKLNGGIEYPKYDDLTALYPALINELKTAISMIDVTKQAFYSGDRIYNGDPVLWKKFAYSLKARLALRLSKVDPNWKSYMADVIADPSLGFTSNDDEAMFKYTTIAPDECSFYRGFFVESRNDFTITKPFCDLLKGQRDTLNNKQHPWEGVVDPRLAIYTTPRNGNYIGMPYGFPSTDINTAIKNASPSWYSTSNHPIMLNKDFSVPLMTYAEYCFILSEANGFSSAEYEKGIRASIAHWAKLAGKTIPQATIDNYVAAVSGTVNAETVATQKYIHLYMQGTEAWSEYRRTGYPKTLLKPGEYTYNKAGSLFKFTTLSDTKGDLPARVKYPTNESTLNPDGFNAAVAKLTDGVNNYYSKMFWDVRTAGDPYPANK
ncbi:MAG: SusD/RagB family nutrient-binding outer membrane lipoprotein [Bacteroidota bacterium]|nr:SusD/RagB family nutrient-binding outer membrane lipoprotein [Bacteroidota bacterium]